MPGEYMIREKSGCDALYIIIEGQLEVFRTGANVEKIPIGIIKSGQYVGETALLLNRMHSSNVVALSPVKAHRLAREAIEQQMKSVPPWLLTLTKGLIDRLQTANELLRRNGLVDETLQNQVKAVSEKFKKAGT
jgi:CRP-like cAMP-binding protein